MLFFLFLFVAGVGYFLLHRSTEREVVDGEPDRNEVAEAGSRSEPGSRTGAEPPEGATPPAPEPESRASRSLLYGHRETGTRIEDDLELVHSLFFNYRTVYRENPVGTHEEIIAQLQGGNDRGIEYLEKNHPHVVRGRLLDRWNTPYFFHAVARDRMEVWSAGPDREFGTGDDVVNRDYPEYPPIPGEASLGREGVRSAEPLG